MTVQLQQVGVQYWFRVLLTVLFCISSVWFGIHQSYSWLGVSLCLLVLSVLWQIRLYRLHTKQVLFMIDALENNDNTFHFTEENGTPESKEINRALNRVGHILYSVKAETAQQEKYYELILDFVSTGLVVLNDNGAVYQKNKEALRILGLNVFTGNVLQRVVGIDFRHGQQQFKVHHIVNNHRELPVAAFAHKVPATNHTDSRIEAG